jgi:hypothetical protein
MPEHDPNRTDRLGAYRHARAAEQGTHEEAARVVERWNAALAAGRGALWSPTIHCAVIAGMPWLDVHCPGCRTSRSTSEDRPPSARQRRKPRAGAPVLVVSGLGADARDHRVACVAPAVLPIEAQWP